MKPRPGRPKGRKVTASLTITVTPERKAAWEAAQKASGLRKVDFYAGAIDAAAKKAESIMSTPGLP
jgi:ribosomal protein L15E